MTNFDLIREFPDHIGAVARLEFLAHDPQPETQWFVEDIDQHQSTRQVWQSSEIDIVPKRHAGFSALEPFPICADAREIRLQFRGYGIGHRRSFHASAFRSAQQSRRHDCSRNRTDMINPTPSEIGLASTRGIEDFTNSFAALSPRHK